MLDDAGCVWLDRWAYLDFGRKQQVLASLKTLGPKCCEKKNIAKARAKHLTIRIQNQLQPWTSPWSWCFWVVSTAFPFFESSQLNPSRNPAFFFRIPTRGVLKLQGSQGGVCWSRSDVDLELPNVQQGCQQLGGGWHEDHGCQEVTNLHLFSQSHGTYL